MTWDLTCDYYIIIGIHSAALMLGLVDESFAFCGIVHCCPMPMKPHDLTLTALYYPFSDPRELKDLVNGDVFVQQVGCAERLVFKSLHDLEVELTGRSL